MEGYLPCSACYDVGGYLRSHPIGRCRIHVLVKAFPHVLYMIHIVFLSDKYLHTCSRSPVGDIFSFVIENKIWEVISAYTRIIEFAHRELYSVNTCKFAKRKEGEAVCSVEEVVCRRFGDKMLVATFFLMFSKHLQMLYIAYGRQ